MKMVILALTLGLAAHAAKPSVVQKPVQVTQKADFKKAEGGKKDKDKTGKDKGAKKGKKERKRKESKKFHPGA